ncbi:mitochondrial carrier domain-containing protein [Lineolata rhizophorae]|uniref:Mitochondrial carrier domain-containing protein n=1 Tax=Lineolata rhizophorae TaxID=578093 RepID=A0A6A6NQY6_9PEZI|nr:mitochondrial carrier domain-containing protein [Lineolata rhizophorae]
MSNKKEVQIPFIQQFAAGAVAGISEILVMYPLDVVKTRLQLQRGPGSGSTHYAGMLDCFRKVIRHEGPSRLYRGILAPILMEAPKRATKFAANDSWSSFYRRALAAPAVTQPLAVLTGASAGATEALVVVPFELVKIRLQDAAHAARYRGAADVVAHVVRADGLRGLYQGFESTVWRHIVWNAGYFGCIFQIRAALPPAESKGQKVRNDLLAGGLGGTVGTLLNTPLDVVKSRIQSAERVKGVVPKYNWTWPAVATVWREEGTRALYKGLLPKLARFCPGGGILLVVYTAVVEVFQKIEVARKGEVKAE